MRESLMYGSVRGTRGNSRPYRDGRLAAIAHGRFWHDPEALGCASEFRLSRRCGPDALAVSLSLHDMGGSRKGPILRHLPDPRYYFNVHT